MTNHIFSLFAVPVHVKRLDGAEMPRGCLGAYLVCYATAPDPLRALKVAVEALREDHYEFLEMNGEIWEVDPNQWNAYVRATWPDAVDSLPSQSEVCAGLNGEDVFYGPFCCYDDAALRLGRRRHR